MAEHSDDVHDAASSGRIQVVLYGDRSGVDRLRARNRIALRFRVELLILQREPRNGSKLKNEVLQMRGCARKREGFTVVELVVVITLMAILTGAAMVIMPDSTGLRADAKEVAAKRSFDSLAQAITYARSFDGRTVALSDGQVNVPFVADATCLEAVEKYTSMPLSEFPDTYTYDTTTFKLTDSDSGASMTFK